MAELASFHAVVRGKVQGVFFRDFTQRHATALGLTGHVKNLPGGDAVEVVAEGDRDRLKQLLDLVKKGPPRARVESLDVEWSAHSGSFKSFEVMH